MATYRRLRSMAIDWSRVDAWVSDERWVPLDHPDCNGNQAADELMDHVGAHFVRPQWAPWLTAAESARQYERELETLIASGRPDLILLGMGSDGHTASLFPGTRALDAPPDRWYVANYVPRLNAERLTATYSLLHSAHRILFLVCGEGKTETLRRVLEPGNGERPLPAARVMDGDSEVIWLVDEAAASALRRTRIETAAG